MIENLKSGGWITWARYETLISSAINKIFILYILTEE